MFYPKSNWGFISRLLIILIDKVNDLGNGGIFSTMTSWHVHFQIRNFQLFYQNRNKVEVNSVKYTSKKTTHLLYLRKTLRQAFTLCENSNSTQLFPSLITTLTCTIYRGIKWQMLKASPLGSFIFNAPNYPKLG